MNCLLCKKHIDENISKYHIYKECGHYICEACYICDKENNICKICQNTNILNKDKDLLTESKTFQARKNIPYTNIVQQNKNDISINKSLCYIHNKGIEAFCNQDKTLLCIKCVLDGKHKEHNVNDIEKAANEEKTYFNKNYNNISNKIDIYNKEVALINSKLKEVNINKENCIKANKKFFEGIYSKIKQIENNSNNDILNLFESTISILTTNKDSLINQINLINNIKEEKNKLNKYSDMDLLIHSKKIYDIFNTISTFNYNNNDISIKNETEIINNTYKKNEIKIINNTLYDYLNDSSDNEDNLSNKDISTYNKSNKDPKVQRFNDILNSVKINNKEDTIPKKGSIDLSSSISNKFYSTGETFHFTSSTNLRDSKRLDKHHEIFANFNSYYTENKKKKNDVKLDLTISEGNDICLMNDSNNVSNDNIIPSDIKSSTNSKKGKINNSKLNTKELSNNKYIKPVIKESFKSNKSKLVKSNVFSNKKKDIVNNKKHNPNPNAYIFNNISKIEDSNQCSILSISKFDLLQENSEFSTLFSKDLKFSIIFFGGKSDMITRLYSMETRIWNNLNNFHIDRSDFVTIPYKEKKYLLLGGKLNINGMETLTDSVEMINIDKMISEKLEMKLQCPKYGFGGVNINNNIYIFGGSDGKNVLDTFEHYDKKFKFWKALPNMIKKRKNFSFIQTPDNCIYVIGGVDNKDQVLKSVEKYDINLNKWINLKELSQKRKDSSAILINNYIYVLGGNDGVQYLKSVEKYDLNNKKWSYSKDMNISKSNFSCNVSTDNQYLFTFGGYNGKPLNSVERFDFKLNKWEFQKELPNPRYKHNSIIINDL